MDFLITNYGAIGDGKTVNTEAIQRAIDECNASGGGRVVVPCGVFTTGTIALKSNVNLHIEAGGKILASPNCGAYDENSDFDLRPYPYNVILTGDITDYGDYPDFPKNHVNRENLPRNRGCCLIFAEECENIAITGLGTIDGNGTQFVEIASESDHHYKKYRRKKAPTPPRITFFTGCRNVMVEDVFVINGPAGWSFWVHDCDYVTFDKVKIDCDLDYPNNDGIHVNCSRNVTISNCDISCSDDCVVVRANSRSLKENKVCEKVTVVNCNMTTPAAGVRVAFVCDGTIRNCVFSNLVMTNTCVGVLLDIPDIRLIQSDFGRESTVVENLRFSNIVMDNVSLPVKIGLFDGEDTHISKIMDISFNGITAKGDRGVIITGTNAVKVQNIRFSNCHFQTKSPVDTFKFSKTENITMDGVSVTVLD